MLLIDAKIPIKCYDCFAYHIMYRDEMNEGYLWCALRNSDDFDCDPQFSKDSRCPIKPFKENESELCPNCKYSCRPIKGGILYCKKHHVTIANECYRCKAFEVKNYEL